MHYSIPYNLPIISSIWNSGLSRSLSTRLMEIMRSTIGRINLSLSVKTDFTCHIFCFVSQPIHSILLLVLSFIFKLMLVYHLSICKHFTAIWLQLLILYFAVRKDSKVIWYSNNICRLFSVACKRVVPKFATRQNIWPAFIIKPLSFSCVKKYKPSL